jgi:type IV pilus assembly protein PilW
MNTTNTRNRMPLAGMAPRVAEQGFTLVELMVAILIGFLITLALVEVFVNVSRTNREMAKTNNQIDNARFALQVLKDDVIHAGFWGPFVPLYDELIAGGIPGDAPTYVPAPCRAYSAANWDATYLRNLGGIVVQTYDAIAAGAAVAGTDSPTGCGGGSGLGIVTNKKANTDVLVVRHAETCVAGVGTCEVATTNKLYIQASSCESELNGTPPVRYKVAQKSAASPDPNLTLKEKDCLTVAGLRKFTSSIYYIRDFARTVGDGIPTLMRSQFDLTGTTPAFQPPVPLVEGIEGFIVELGIDNVSKSGGAVNYGAAIAWQDTANLTTPTNRGDGSADGAFIRCTTGAPCTAAQLTDVVAVKIHVLARAETTSPEHTDTKTYNLGATTLGPFNDKFKRHVFSTTVRLNNVSGRRETP